ncbi:MAG TPA: FeoA family protein [Gemmatimonadaceae bacterium]|nr:FeoA family protein [Gemmatimonadaceae bacterium]
MERRFLASAARCLKLARAPSPNLSDENPEVLRYLAKIGMTLGSRVRVVLRGPFAGPLSTITPDGLQQPLDIELARQIEVAA